MYKGKAFSGNVQKTKTITPPTFFMELYPFVNIGMGIVFSRYFHEAWYNC